MREESEKRDSEGRLRRDGEKVRVEEWEKKGKDRVRRE